ncbi:MAG TPA: hypothetical protein DD490_32785, partial [Acidobacteria bacterium]|nr:hypothetical protein [Acidobacteriota bacterium]
MQHARASTKAPRPYTRTGACPPGRAVPLRDPGDILQEPALRRCDVLLRRLLKEVPDEQEQTSVA